MDKRISEMCWDLAFYMRHPAESLEIGSLADAYRGIIRNITERNKAVRQKVLEICHDRVYDGDYDTTEYTSDPDTAMKLITEDYDVAFFK